MSEVILNGTETEIKQVTKYCKYINGFTMLHTAAIVMDFLPSKFFMVRKWKRAHLSDNVTNIFMADHLCKKSSQEIKKLMIKLEFLFFLNAEI